MNARSPARRGQLLLLAACLAWPAPGLAKRGGPAAGSAAPNFTLPGLAGDGPSGFPALKGEVVLLDFWASWCAPCKRSLPGLAAIGRRLPGLAVVAVGLDEDKDKADAFLRGMDTALITLSDDRHIVARLYDPGGMPSAFLVDRRGKVRARFDGYGERDLPRIEKEARLLMEEKP